jgi:Protein of unknown function (DUF1524)
MRERNRRFLLVVVIVLSLVGGVGAKTLQHQAQPAVPESAPAQNGDGELTTKVLDTLATKGRAPKTGYTREQFGNGWADQGDCDTRNKVLQRDLITVQTRSTTDCTVLSGDLHDPYTAKDIHFTRGAGTSTAIQIDHVVALSDAWQTGAQQLSADTRRQLANDPLELLAVDGPANEAKGDGDAATWLPPNKAFRCAYVSRQVAVKSKYQLWVTPAEQGAIQHILASCPSQKVPTS